MATRDIIDYIYSKVNPKNTEGNSSSNTADNYPEKAFEMYITKAVETYSKANVGGKWWCHLCKRSYPLIDDMLDHTETIHNVIHDQDLDAIVISYGPSISEHHRNIESPSPIALEREKFASEGSRKLRAEAEILQADIQNTKNEICKKIMHLNFLSAKANAKKTCEMRGLVSEKVEEDLAIFIYNKLIIGSSDKLNLKF